MKIFKIVYLCHDLLDFDGTRGDMIYFLHRLDAYGISYSYQKHLVGEKIDVSDFDFIYAGVAPCKYEHLFLRCLKEDVTGLKTYIEAGKIMLAVEQSFLFLGKMLKKAESKIPLLDILPFTVTENKAYTIGNVLLKSQISLDGVGEFRSELNGFFNSRYQFWTDQEDCLAVGTVLLGQDYLWERGFEGLVYKGFLGTQLRGPILPRNYDLCDYLISQMTKRTLPEISSSLEKAAKEHLTEESYAFIESGEQKKEYNYVS
ncbi:MAG: hypothetical protein ACRC6X_05845 [Culicoidibacterales bacterium]